MKTNLKEFLSNFSKDEMTKELNRNFDKFEIMKPVLKKEIKKPDETNSNNDFSNVTLRAINSKVKLINSNENLNDDLKRHPNEVNDVFQYQKNNIFNKVNSSIKSKENKINASWQERN